MVIGQVLLTLVGVGAFPRLGPGWSAAASVLLALACLVSVASGFFDGGLGHRDLTPGLVGYQVFLLVVTASVGGLAAWRVAVLLRRP
jgi:hypothetical protein